MRQLVSRLERTVEWLMALALAVMVVMVFGNVVLRYVFNSGIAAARSGSTMPTLPDAACLTSKRTR